MKRIVALLVLGLLAFYAGWPAWSGYRIGQAFRNEDPNLLASKIDFASVRTSLKPVIATEVSGRVERAKREAGPLGNLIAGQFKDELVTRIVDGTLTSVVTPESVIRIARQGGNLREAVEKVVIEQVGRAGGGTPGSAGNERGGLRLPGGLNLPGVGTIPGRKAGDEEQAKPSNGPQPTGGQKPSFGIGNVKKFSINSPLSFTVGVARDPNATEPDVTAIMAFTGLDWKVVGIIPRL
ncbi:MAG: DUF2939 domain-containing protein [Hyphomicrobiaceae bacterium]